jgi:hypothetical protein
MDIEIIEDHSLWDSFVEESPDKLLFHKWDFLKIIEKYSGGQLFPFGIFERENLICLFPLFYVKKYGIKFLNSPPFGSGIPYNGFLNNPDFYLLKQRQKESYLNKVAETICTEIKRISPNIINIYFGPRIDDIRPFKWFGYDIDIYYSYVIDLGDPTDLIWNSFEKKCRTEIRKSEKYNLFMKESKDIKTFYSIMEERYNQQNLKFSNFGSEYYYDILEAFPNNVKLYFFYNDEKIINLTMNYQYNDRLVFWKGWVNLDKTINSNEFFTWEFIKKAKMEGLKTLELQGANTKRLCRFKSKYNPRIETYFSITKKDKIGRLSEYLYRKIVPLN